MPINKQRVVANVRERKRTQLLNQAYKQLQSIIPKEPSDKMSKIHTLKLALAYIEFLNDLLKAGDHDQRSSPQPSDGRVKTSATGTTLPDNDLQRAELHERQHLQLSPANQLTTSVHEQPQQLGSPPVQVCSPCSSTYVSQTCSSEEEAETEYGHRAKRARYSYDTSHQEHQFEHQQHLAQAQQSQYQPIATDCHTSKSYHLIDSFRQQHIPTVTNNFDQQQYLSPACYPTSSTSSLYECSDSSTYGANITTIVNKKSSSLHEPATADNLRTAFREYRAVKRKYLRLS